jgi:hypothetical protein
MDLDLPARDQTSEMALDRAHRESAERSDLRGPREGEQPLQEVTGVLSLTRFE